MTANNPATKSPRETSGLITDKFGEISLGISSRLPAKPERIFDIESWLNGAVKHNASDVLIKPGSPVKLRIQGRYRHAKDGAVLTPDDSLGAIYALASEHNLAELDREGSFDSSFELAGTRFRVHAFSVRGGYGVSIRILPEETLSLEQIGVPPKLLELIERPRGLIIVSGPTGSGKTTTLAAICREIVKNPNRHLVTIEEPVEFIIPETKEGAPVTQRQVGENTPTFARGLTDSLREDPDVIMVGEMRDQHTVKTALQAAETGHMVLSTLHATSVDRALPRVAHYFGGAERDKVAADLSEALTGVLIQTLLPRADGKGRVAAFEFLWVQDDAVRNNIRKQELHKILSIMQTGRSKGQLDMDTHLLELVQSGVVDAAVAIQHARRPDSFIKQLG